MDGRVWCRDSLLVNHRRALVITGRPRRHRARQSSDYVVGVTRCVVSALAGRELLASPPVRLKPGTVAKPEFCVPESVWPVAAEFVRR